LPENVAAAREYGNAPVLACLPYLEQIDLPVLHALNCPEL